MIFFEECRRSFEALVWIAVFGIPVSGFAQNLNWRTEAWKFGNQKLELMSDSARGIRLLPSCVQVQRECEAWTHYQMLEKKSDLRSFRRDLERVQRSKGGEGKNPASLYCTEILGGEVIIGQSPRGNSSAFCRFADQSLINAQAFLTLIFKE